ncbi:hypothetical protein ACTFIV_009864 [Dictyostelium citrinum]
MKRISNRNEDATAAKLSSTTITTTNKYYSLANAEKSSKSTTISNLIPKYSLFNESNNDNDTNSSTRPNKQQKLLKPNESTTVATTTTPTKTTTTPNLSKYYNYNLYIEKQNEKQNLTTNTTNTTIRPNSMTTTTTTTTKQIQNTTLNNSIATTTTTNHFLPLIIQKEIIFLLVGLGSFLNARKVCKYWKKVCNGCVENLNIYFTDIHLSASVKHVSEVFVKSLNSDYFHLQSVSFINGAKNSISYSEFYFNNVILPFIENVVRYNQTIQNFTIKGFPITRINNKSSQQLSHSYKLYHSTSIPSSPPPQFQQTTTTSIAAVPSSTSTTGQTSSIINNNIPKGLYYYLTNNFKLKKINLKNIGLDSRDKFDFFSSLSSSVNNTLETLIICDNIGDEGMQLLSVILIKNLLKVLKRLELQKNQFTNQSAYYLNKVLGNEQLQLVTLNLSSNRIDEQGLIMMKDGFGRNKSLKEFIFSKNRLGNTDSIDFGKSITSLDLHDSMVGSKQSIKGLSQYLKTNESITSLNLSFNHIGSSEAIKSLSKSFAVNQTLKVVDLSFNKINSNFGLDHLVSSLLINHSIHSISLQSNHIDNTSTITLSQLFNSSRQLFSPFKYLNLSGNKIGIGGLKKLINNLSKYSKTHIIHNNSDNNNNNNKNENENKSKIKNLGFNNNNHNNNNLNNNNNNSNNIVKIIKNYHDTIPIIRTINNSNAKNLLEEEVEQVINSGDNNSIDTHQNDNINGDNNLTEISIDLSSNSPLEVSKVIGLIPRYKSRLTFADKKPVKKYKLVKLLF